MPRFALQQEIQATIKNQSNIKHTQSLGEKKESDT
jgi:hypothetical protein